ncbi:MAG TPA: acylphosphatase [Treponema sp.]|nr:MAG: hypothetical protein A2Y36_05060 [Treponema sp. GWA1_62_8]OHE64465.1 MAG: hypothetical protein A2001_02265 [Treponema sp. GWC1_61_84]OHE75496.1 MAG: hypothetical protein A2413_13715 [Treponema sp. RIFOXYC1_FULL_61_9]HCM26699.1 acylphosphatase [Treponema sp.]
MDPHSPGRKNPAAFSARAAGRVQGVGFRWAARDEAGRLGLSGWVRNERDGSVSVFAQGEKERLERFERWLRRGPPGARVVSFEKSPAQPDPALAEFIIEP